MGCKKISRFVLYRKAGHAKDSLVIALIVTMLITAITPLAIAGEHAETINVTFTPSGDLDIIVSPNTATWASVAINDSVAHNSDEGGNSSYTLSNNGGLDAHIWVFTNDSTDSNDWDLDGTGWEDGFTGSDLFALRLCNSTTTNQWLTTSNTSWVPTLDAGADHLFGICISLSNASGSSVMDPQASMISITATQA